MENQSNEQRDEKIKERIVKILNTIPIEELSLIPGRYCGPYNVVLCEKKFGYDSHKYLKKIIDQYIKDRSFEETVLNVTE